MTVAAHACTTQPVDINAELKYSREGETSAKQKLSVSPHF